MKITRTLQVTECAFYDYLENEIITNIDSCANKEITTNDIMKGLCYTKQGDNVYSRVEVTILEYERGKLYKAKIHSMADTIILSYETSVVEKGLQIIFHQYIESFENKKQNRFLRLFSEGVYYGRMSDTLYDIQKKILNHHAGIAEVEQTPISTHKHLKKLIAKKS